MRSLLRLLPYYRPYKRDVWLGLLLTVLSSAAASVPPWFVQAAVDGMRAEAPLSRIFQLAGAIVGVTIVAGAMRYGMREFLNGLSRRIEYDLRNDLFATLSATLWRGFSQWRHGQLDDVAFDGVPTPYVQQLLQEEYDGDVMKMPVHRVFINEANRTGIGTYAPHDPNTADIADLVGSVDLSKVAKYGDELHAGAMVTVEPGRVRVRPAESDS